jgi:hypothetical protein
MSYVTVGVSEVAHCTLIFRSSIQLTGSNTNTFCRHNVKPSSPTHKGSYTMDDGTKT